MDFSIICFYISFAIYNSRKIFYQLFLNRLRFKFSLHEHGNRVITVTFACSSVSLQNSLYQWCSISLSRLVLSNTFSIVACISKLFCLRFKIIGERRDIFRVSVSSNIGTVRALFLWWRVVFCGGASSLA